MLKSTGQQRQGDILFVCSYMFTYSNSSALVEGKNKITCWFTIRIVNYIYSSHNYYEGSAILKAKR